MGGKSGGSTSVPKNPYQDELAKIAAAIFAETTPLRQGLTGNFESLFGIDPRLSELKALQAQSSGGRGGTQSQSGQTRSTFQPSTGTVGSFKIGQQADRGGRSNNSGVMDQIAALQSDIDTNPFQGSNIMFDPVTSDNISANPLFALLKDANEQQFDLAQDRAMSILPQGGSLNQGLSDIERGRASSMVASMGGLAENEQQRRQLLTSQALGLASGGTTGAMQGFGNAGALQSQAASTQAMLANANANRDAGKSQGIGQIAGMAITKGKCWVAREVYGIDNPRWVIFYHWKEHRAPILFKHLYNILGKLFAKLIRRNNKLKIVIRAWMDSKIAEYL